MIRTAYAMGTAAALEKYAAGVRQYSRMFDAAKRMNPAASGVQRGAESQRTIDLLRGADKNKALTQVANQTSAPRNMAITDLTKLRAAVHPNPFINTENLGDPLQFTGARSQSVARAHAGFGRGDVRFQMETDPHLKQRHQQELAAMRPADQLIASGSHDKNKILDTEHLTTREGNKLHPSAVTPGIVYHGGPLTETRHGPRWVAPAAPVAGQYVEGHGGDYMQALDTHGLVPGKDITHPMPMMGREGLKAVGMDEKQLAQLVRNTYTSDGRFNYEPQYERIVSPTAKTPVLATYKPLASPGLFRRVSGTHNPLADQIAAASKTR